MRAFRGLGLIVIAALAIGAIVTGASAQSGGSYNYPQPTPPGGGNNAGKPTLRLAVKANKAKPVLRRGVKVTARCDRPCIVKVRAFKGSRTFGIRTKRFARGRGSMFVKLNKVAKQRVKRRVRAGKGIKFAVSGVARDAANRKSATARATVKVKKPRKRG